jgi:hypothetical protein
VIEADLVVVASPVDHRPLEVDVRPPKGDDGAKAMPVSPVLEVPMHWVQPFAELARDLDLPVRDAHDAIEPVRAFVERIRAA